MASETKAANADQIEAWNGSVGVKWAANQERLDRMLTPFSEAVLAAAAVRPGEHVLDIGCGCGATTLEIARAVGEAGRVLGVDISAPMTARGRDRAKALALPATFELADASTYAFEPDAFDVMISRFGVMFFDEPASAFANIRKGLKKGARLAFVCWRSFGENPWVTVPLAAALAHVAPPEPTPPGAPGPFAFADRDRLASILETAGFRDISISPFDTKLMMGTEGGGIEEALMQSVEIGPLGRLIANAPEEVVSRIRESVRAALVEHQIPDGRVALGGATWLVTAHA